MFTKDVRNNPTKWQRKQFILISLRKVHTGQIGLKIIEIKECLYVIAHGYLLLLNRVPQLIKLILII